MFDYFYNKYMISKLLGEGSFGKVFKCEKKKNKNIYAAKFIDLYYPNNKYNIDLYSIKAMIYEIEFLRNLNHKNIIKTNKILYDNYYICIIGELMDNNLRNLRKNTLSKYEIKYILYQIFLGIEYLHSLNIIHRDIKSDNILINSDLKLKIADFGLASIKNVDCNMNDYVVTRWYRAPELLTDNVEYDELIDIWSIGCIAIELINNNKPLFCGKNVDDQLLQITSIIGGLPNSLLNKLNNDRKEYFLNINDFKNILVDKFSHIDPLLLDLISKLLCYKEDRLSAKQALLHPYFKDFHYVKDESLYYDKEINNLKNKLYKLSKKIKNKSDEELIEHLNKYNVNIRINNNNNINSNINSNSNSNIIQPKPIKANKIIPILV